MTKRIRAHLRQLVRVKTAVETRKAFTNSDDRLDVIGASYDGQRPSTSPHLLHRMFLVGVRQKWRWRLRELLASTVLETC